MKKNTNKNFSFNYLLLTTYFLFISLKYQNHDEQPPRRKIFHNRAL